MPPVNKAFPDTIPPKVVLLPSFLRTFSLVDLGSLQWSHLFLGRGGSGIEDHNCFLSVPCHLCLTQRLVYGGNTRKFPENGTEMLGDTVGPETEAKQPNI